jgi:hypothetical protein
MDRLERELQQGLRSVTAPPELWERVRAAQALQPGEGNRGLVWALAMAVFLAAVALSLVRPPDEAFAIRALADGSPGIAFRCQNPAQIRAWVRANTGLDLPLRDGPSLSIQLIGAQTIDGTRGVEVAYRAGNRDAVLVVSRAEAGSARRPHARASGDASGNVSTWVTDGQRYTLACNDPAGLQLACKLCHLD